MAKFSLGAQINDGAFQFYSDASNANVVKYISSKDINNDGVDEIFFYGFETQPNTPSNYSNTSIHIFGWVKGVLKEITNQWLPNNSNSAEAVGDIAFGDFNNDNLLDVYMSGNADMNYTINAYALMNKGTYFEKINLGPTQWEHGVAAGDINLDGFSDIVVAGYSHPSIFLLGGANGLTKHLVSDNQAASFNINSYETHGSGVAIADFLGDGGVSVVIVDSAASSPRTSDTRLLSVEKDTAGVVIGFRYISTLPTPRLELPKYGITNAAFGQSHDIRARTFDFNHDGLDDVIVISAASADLLATKGRLSELQFLLNKGSGVFEDVTESYLVGFDTTSGSSYNPAVMDLNGDDLADIFLSDSDWRSVNNSTGIILQNAAGKFIDTDRKQLSNIFKYKNGSIAGIAKGPDGSFYIVKDESSNGDGLQSISAYKLTFIENRAPALTKSLADVSVNEGKSISYSISAAFKDPDNADTLTYAVSLEDGAALPNWLSFNASTKKLIGTLPYNVDVNFSVKVTATDQDGLSVADIFSVNTKNVSDIKGTNAANTIIAGIGNDSINGGLGNDTLAGGDGNDTFAFNSKLGASNIDTITDFTSGADKIALDDAIFSKLKGISNLADNLYIQSIPGISTQDSNDYLFYDFESGRLYYDADGSGTKSAAVMIAIVGSATEISGGDFMII